MSGAAGSKRRSKTPSKSRKDSKNVSDGRKSKEPQEVQATPMAVLNDENWRTYLFFMDGDSTESESVQELVSTGIRSRFHVVTQDDLLHAPTGTKDRSRDALHDQVRTFVSAHEAVPPPLLAALLHRRLLEDRETGLDIKAEQQREAQARLEEQAEKERAEREAMQRALRGDAGGLSGKSVGGAGTGTKKDKRSRGKKEKEKSDKKDAKSPATAVASAGSAANNPNRSATPEKAKVKEARSKSTAKDGAAKKGAKKTGAAHDPDFVPLDDEPDDGPDAYYLLAGFPKTAEFVQCLSSQDMPLHAVISLSGVEKPMEAPSSPAPAFAEKTAEKTKDKKDVRRKEKKSKKSKGKEKTKKDSTKHDAGNHSGVGDANDSELELAADASFVMEAAAAEALPLCSAEAALLRFQASAPNAAQCLKDIVWIYVDDASVRPASDVFDEFARHIFHSLECKPVYDTWKASMDTLAVGSAPAVATVPMTHYRRLMAQIPADAASVPVILHCMLEQLEFNASGVVPTEEEAVKKKESKMARLLSDAHTGVAMATPPRASRSVSVPTTTLKGNTTEAPSLLLLEHGDGIALRALARKSADASEPEDTDEEVDVVATMDVEAVERSMLRLLPTPWVRREWQETDDSEEGASTVSNGRPAHIDAVDRHELYSFANFPPEQVERALLFSAFEELLSPLSWSLSDRTFVEEMSPDVLSQVLLNVKQLRHTIACAHYPRDDLMLVAVKPIPTGATRRCHHYVWESQIRCSLGFGAFVAAIDRGEKFFDVPITLLPFDPNPPKPATPPLENPKSLFAAAAAANADNPTAKKRGRFFRDPTPEPEPTPPPTYGREAYDVGDKRLGMEVATATLFPADGASVHVDVLTDHSGAQKVQVTVRVKNVLFGMHHSLPPPATTSPPPVPRAPPVEADESAVVDGDPAQMDEASAQASQAPTPQPSTQQATPLPTEEKEKEPSVVVCMCQDGSTIGVADQGRALNFPGLMALQYTQCNGVICQVGLDGVIQQSYPLAATHHLKDTGPRRRHAGVLEAGRCIFGKGSVLRYLRSGTIEVYYANGNTAAYDPSNGVWVCTNSDGVRKGTVAATGQEFYVPPVDVADSTAPDTGERVRMREDLVSVTRTTDGRVVASFPDSTKIDCNGEPDSATQMVISCDGYAPVTLDLEAKLATVHFDDGTFVKGSPEYVVVEKSDGMWVHATKNEVACVAPGSALTHAVYRERERQMKDGLYLFNLAAGSMMTLDTEKNAFSVDRLGRAQVMLCGEETAVEAAAVKVPGGVDSDEEADEAQPLQPKESAPTPLLTHPPRLFVVRKDGSGTELLAEGKTMASLRRLQGQEGVSVVREALAGSDGASRFTIVSRLPKVFTATNAVEPVVVRQLTKFPAVTDAILNKVRDAVVQHQDWKEGRAEYAAGLEVRDKRTPDEVAEAENVQRRIVESRLHLSDMEAPVRSILREQDAGQETEDDEGEVKHDSVEAQVAAAPVSAINSQRIANISSRWSSRRAQEHVKEESCSLFPKEGGPPPSYFHSSFGAAFLEDQSRRKIGDVMPALVPKYPVGGAGSLGEVPASVSDSDEEGDAPPVDPVEVGTDAGYEGSRTGSDAERSSRGGADSPRRSGSALGGGRKSRASEVDFMGNTRASQILIPKTHSGERGVPNERYARIEGPARRTVKTSSVRRLNSPGGTNPLFGFQIYPSEIQFGVLKVGQVYRASCTLTNAGVDLCRLRIKKCSHPAVRPLHTPGPAAPGMKVKVEVEIIASEEVEIDTVVEVETEAQIFRVPVYASVVGAEQYALLASNNNGRNPLRQGVRDFGPIPIPAAPAAVRKDSQNSSPAKKVRRQWELPAATAAPSANVIPPINSSGRTEV